MVKIQIEEILDIIEQKYKIDIINCKIDIHGINIIKFKKWKKKK